MGIGWRFSAPAQVCVQDFNLLNTLSVRDNIAAIGLDNMKKEIHRRIEEVAAGWNCPHTDKRTYEISGGGNSGYGCPRVAVHRHHHAADGLLLTWIRGVWEVMLLLLIVPIRHHSSGHPWSFRGQFRRRSVHQGREGF